jgi:single-stranded-DNA-specific exonuclease
MDRVSEREACLWEVRGGRSALDTEKLREETGMHPVLGELLARRGFASLESIRAFLAPRLSDLHDPFLLPDMRKAAERLWRAVDGRERMLVHGDYDVDGVTSAAMLVRFFTSVGAHVDHMLPNRLTDGYGLSERAVDEAVGKGASVLLTADCGITDHGPVAQASARGIDTIVTDHHLPQDTLPAALAVVAPSRRDASYPTPHLSGVGVAFKLLQAMAALRPGAGEAPEEFLDLVALGTVADVVPLTGENRVLVHHGLQRLSSPTRVGLEALKNVAGFGKGEPVSSGQVAFRLAPRLNAAGRLGTAERAAERALDLLLAEDADRARELALELDQENQRRRQMDERTLGGAVEEIEAVGVGERRILVLAGEQTEEAWHPGVIGIVASRLVKRYGLPAVLVAFGDGEGKGSGRSIDGFDLSAALTQCAEWLEAFGGHEQAAGLTVRREKFEPFRRALERVAAERITPEMTRERLVVDGIIRLSDCTMDLVEELGRLEPHGEGNERPRFAALGARIVGSPRVVGGGHLKFTAEQDGSTVNAIAFGMGARAADLKPEVPVDLAFSLAEDRWGLGRRPQLRVVGLRASRSG